MPDDLEVPTFARNKAGEAEKDSEAAKAKADASRADAETKAREKDVAADNRRKAQEAYRNETDTDKKNVLKANLHAADDAAYKARQAHRDSSRTSTETARVHKDKAARASVTKSTVTGIKKDFATRDKAQAAEDKSAKQAQAAEDKSAKQAARETDRQTKTSDRLATLKKIDALNKKKQASEKRAIIGGAIKSTAKIAKGTVVGMVRNMGKMAKNFAGVTPKVRV